MKKNTMKLEVLDNIVYLTILYDFYGALLSDAKKEVYEDYFLNDLSLSEIAKKQKISRQGVHDRIRRTSEELKDYEAKLSLLAKFRTIELKLEEISSLSYGIIENKELKNSEKIKTLVEDILKEL